VQREQPFDAVDLPGALAREPEHLAMQMPPILLVDARHVHSAPHRTLAAVVVQ
jgi:hypothetical protein